MQATLSFTLPDEQEEFDDATKGGSWHCACDAIVDWLRAEEKYGEPKTVKQRHRVEVLREVRERVYEIRRDRELGE